MVRTKTTQRPDTPSYGGKEHTYGHQRTGHLSHHVPQTSKHKDYPDGLPAIDYENRVAATDGKYDVNTDGPGIHDSTSHGWMVDGDTLKKSKPRGLAGNKVRAMVLSPFPEVGQETHQTDSTMGSKVVVLHDCIIDTIHAHTHEYIQPRRI